MKSSVKYSLVITIAVILVAVVYMNSNSKHEVVSVPVPEKTEKSGPDLVFPKEEDSVAVKKVVPSEKEMPANPYLTKESMASLAPTMKEFLLLDMKSIKNTDETKEFYSLLRSTNAIADAQKILLSINVENIMESEREHLTATRFLARALGDLNNKSNKALNEIVKKIILEDNISGNLPDKAKMIFAGDKAELVQTYIAFNPNGHKEILGRTKNLQIKKIIENAYKYNESMRASN
jgi:hypothetical protein